MRGGPAKRFGICLKIGDPPKLAVFLLFLFKTTPKKDAYSQQEAVKIVKPKGTVRAGGFPSGNWWNIHNWDHVLVIVSHYNSAI